jgi:hypothetical protein
LAYPVNVLDRVVQYPHRYQLTLVSGTTYDLSPVAGTITEAGTDINRALLQQLFDSMLTADPVGKIYSYKNIGGSL